jgi:V8-like Glu-specific endopeptidase
VPDLRLSGAGAVLSVATQPDGKIIVGGSFSSVNGVIRNNLARINTDGSPDLTWNPDVKGGSVGSIAISGTNVIVGGDFTSIGSHSIRGLAKLSTSGTGSPDLVWNPDPIRTNSGPISVRLVSGIALAGTNLFVGGDFTSIGGLNRRGLAKISLDGVGAADPNWNPNPDGGISVLALEESNLFVGGEFNNIGGLPRVALAKIDALGVGALDSNWNPNPVITGLPAVEAIAINQSNLYVGGGFSYIGAQPKPRLAKLTASGSGEADPLWNPDISDDLYPSVNSIVATESSVYVGGAFKRIGGQNRTNLAKLNVMDGGADPNWDSSIRLLPGQIGYQAQVHAVALSQSHLYVGGNFSSIGEVPSSALARLRTANGARDASFPAQIQVPGNVSACALQPDGKIVLGGSFSYAAGLIRQNLARVNRDGTLDRTWAPNPDGPVSSIAITEGAVFVGGRFTQIGGQQRQGLAKIPSQSDTADLAWNPNPELPSTPDSGLVTALIASGSNLFVAGVFTQIGGRTRTNLAKLTTFGSGEADLDWAPNPVPRYPDMTLVGLPPIGAIALSGTTLYVGPGFAGFTNISGKSRSRVAKLNTTGSGELDENWGPQSPEFVWAMQANGTNLYVSGDSTLMRFDANNTGELDLSWTPKNGVRAFSYGFSGTNLYVGGQFQNIDGFPRTGLARLSTVPPGNVDDSWVHNLGEAYGRAIADTVAMRGEDIYVGGSFGSVAATPRYGFAFLPVSDAPQLIQDSPTNLFIMRNEADGPEVTHFRITSISGGTFYRSDGVTPVNAGEFLTAAEGSAGLKFAPGGTVRAVSALNNTPAGAGTATNSLTMITNPSPAFKFSAVTYSVREGQGNIVVTVRKYGNGAASVNYATSDLSATGNLDYQTRSGTFNFSATDKVKNLIIAIADDLLLEGDEQFAITLTNSSTNAVIAGPATSIVTIVDNDIVGLADSLTTTVAPTNPPASNGALSVSLQPTNAHGQWRLIGELNWHDSGTLVSGLVTGNYGVEFHPANGYREPQNVTIPIAAGTTNSVTFLYAATTNLATGNLSITIQPADVATAGTVTNRGQWRWQSESAWLNSDEVVPNLNAGKYTVAFKSVPGRIAPPPRIIEVGGGNATYGTIVTYLFAPPASGEPPTVVLFDIATTNEPYLFNGQIQTSVGFGSGFVVKPRVVLTAAHVLFDDVQLSYVTGARWFFQRYRDQLEPVPQIPYGWYVYEGYAAQRQVDNSPGISTPDSQNLDMAAMYFLEDAGRGGSGGYLSSDADANEYLLSANNKFLVGYPLDGVVDGNQGKLHATTPANITFTRLYASVFSTTNIQAFPGNSGGPLYVQADVEKYLPAGIVLGGSGQTLVRAINSEVVDLINRAEISANGGGNVVGGGPIPVSPGQTAPPLGTGLLTVSMTPSNMIGVRPGWRVSGIEDTNYFTDALTTVALVGGGGYPIEFKGVPGFLTPSNRVVQVAVNQVVRLPVQYEPIRPGLSLQGGFNLSLSGPTGISYRVEYATNLAPPVLWMPWTTQTVLTSPLIISNIYSSSNNARFYRATWSP